MCPPFSWRECPRVCDVLDNKQTKNTEDDDDQWLDKQTRKSDPCRFVKLDCNSRCPPNPNYPSTHTPFSNFRRFSFPVDSFSSSDLILLNRLPIPKYPLILAPSSCNLPRQQCRGHHFFTVLRNLRSPPSSSSDIHFCRKTEQSVHTVITWFLVYCNPLSVKPALPSYV